jgi:hypothetical protein
MSKFLNKSKSIRSSMQLFDLSEIDEFLKKIRILKKKRSLFLGGIILLGLL